jgi:hypothetical protein
MLWQLILTIITYYIGEQIMEYVIQYIAQLIKQQPQCIMDVINGALQLSGLAETWKNVQQEFSDPDCSQLLKDQNMEYKQVGGTQTMTLIDNNGLYYYS